MARYKKNIPLLSDVLAYWRWYDEMAAGAALPESYQQFTQKIAASFVLPGLCSDQRHDLRWRHALRAQLGAMWEQFRYPQMTIKKSSKGRPAHFQGDFTFQLCVLDTIIIHLLSSPEGTVRRPNHWPITARLMREFFRDKCREKDGWTGARVKARVNLYLRKHPNDVQDIRLLTEARAEAARLHAELVDAELKARRTPRKPTGPSPTAIVFKLADPIGE